MQSYTKIRFHQATPCVKYSCVTRNVYIHNNVGCMIFVLGLTHIDGPYLHAWLSADVSECVWTVIVHHSAELKQTHI